MGEGTISNRRRITPVSSTQPSAPSRAKPPSGRKCGRPLNVLLSADGRPPPIEECLKLHFHYILDRLIKKDHFNIFLEPVNTDDVIGYLDVVKRPMDLTSIRNKVKEHKYGSLGEFRRDLDLIWSNCLLFNGDEPTNVYSKKAVELRSLTEKLIASARRQLGQVGEALNQWKEKHSNGKNENCSVNTPTQPDESGSMPRETTPKTVNKLPGPHGPSSTDYDMEGAANNFEAEGNICRTPREAALLEALRGQYNRNSCLYKESQSNNHLPRYTRPDGSVVDIPIPKYDPTDENWGEEAGLTSESRHRNAPLRLRSDSLPLPPATNPCRPRPGLNAISTDDYVTSVLQYMKSCGDPASALAFECLSPELLVRVYQERLKQQGLDPSTLLKHSEGPRQRIPRQRIPRPDYHPQFKWTADTIIQFMDDFERSKKANVSFLPRPSGISSGTNGIESLKRYLDPKTLKEVEDVPSQVIDHSMPHGVQTDALRDILQSVSNQNVHLNTGEQDSIQRLERTATEFIGRQPPAQRERLMMNAVSTDQLHQEQLGERTKKRQRRCEAECVAATIEQIFSSKDLVSPVESIPSRQKSDAKEKNHGMHRTSKFSTQGTHDPTALPVNLDSGCGDRSLCDLRSMRGNQNSDQNMGDTYHGADRMLPNTPYCSKCGSTKSKGWQTDPEGCGTICWTCYESQKQICLHNAIAALPASGSLVTSGAVTQTGSVSTPQNYSTIPKTSSNTVASLSDGRNLSNLHPANRSLDVHKSACLPAQSSEGHLHPFSNNTDMDPKVQISSRPPPVHTNLMEKFLPAQAARGLMLTEPSAMPVTGGSGSFTICPTNNELKFELDHHPQTHDTTKGRSNPPIWNALNEKSHLQNAPQNPDFNPILPMILHSNNLEESISFMNRTTPHASEVVISNRDLNQTNVQATPDITIEPANINKISTNNDMSTPFHRSFALPSGNSEQKQIGPISNGLSFQQNVDRGIGNMNMLPRNPFPSANGNNNGNLSHFMTPRGTSLTQDFFESQGLGSGRFMNLTNMTPELPKTLQYPSYQENGASPEQNHISPVRMSNASGSLQGSLMPHSDLTRHTAPAQHLQNLEQDNHNGRIESDRQEMSGMMVTAPPEQSNLASSISRFSPSNNGSFRVEAHQQQSAPQTFGTAEEHQRHEGAPLENGINSNENIGSFNDVGENFLLECEVAAMKGLIDQVDF